MRQTSLFDLVNEGMDLEHILQELDAWLPADDIDFFVTYCQIEIENGNM